MLKGAEVGARRMESPAHGGEERRQAQGLVDGHDSLQVTIGRAW